MELTSREDLSALMDGELATEPTRFLLRRLDHDPELSATWSRWHLIRACLAADPARMSAPRIDDDFATRIAAALQAEHAPQQVQRRRHWARYVGGGALAAGVAAVALMLHAPGAPIGQSAVATVSAPVVNATLAQAATTPVQSAPPWLLPRQPTVLSAEPASADVVYGTGLMQPDYLQRAAYANDEALPYTTSFQDDASTRPFSIVLLPAAPASSAQAVLHH